MIFLYPNSQYRVYPSKRIYVYIIRHIYFVRNSNYIIATSLSFSKNDIIHIFVLVCAPCRT